jgi:di/tripeptidase
MIFVDTSAWFASIVPSDSDELNKEYESKLVYVQEKTDKLDLKATVEAAIDAYYQSTKAKSKNSLRDFSRIRIYRLYRSR